MRTSRAVRPRTGTLTTTEYAVLTVLAVETPCVALSGYDLLKIVERTTRYFWKPTKSHLYAVLPRLVERGLATRRAAPSTRARSSTRVVASSRSRGESSSSTRPT